ncbi:hypothetical protein ALI144C_15195 [Actinosynnema sp. ALI-1.44]|uniref:DUF5753 domain-containing protein n=1 Tax=Actinosynnema sp. ALI-1.44 TaxID=1933779 RepID=UPI00097CC059|nr:DUF5753 domain-containing protein [Actinosynnema sp. ALI-1.44]ONI84057.1 hypothetical protein ALI144C_15195 [Actinosynnema sp. ALI-1.44]
MPTYHELVILLDAYGVLSCDYTPYAELWELAKQRPWWQEFDLDDVRCVRLEDYASRKIEYQLGQIPALLHTEAYARTTIAQQCPSLVAKRVAFLTRQQERLTTQPLLEFHALIHESVLGHGVDRAQLAKLVECAQLPNVTIQIVSERPVSVGLTSSVCVLSFDDHDEPDCVFTESVIGLQESHVPGQTRKIKHLLGNVARRATNPEQSLAMIRAMLT